MQLRKVEHPFGKSFHWACNGPDCPWESEEIKYTMEKYDPYPPMSCPKCGRANQVDLMKEGMPAGQQPAKPSVSPGEVGHWNHPDRE